MTSPQALTPSARSLMGEGILLALATAVGWTLAFTYEAGYLAWYGVPAWFVQVSAERILLTASALAGVFLFIRFFLWGLPNKPWWALAVVAWRPALLGFLMFGLVINIEWRWGYHLLLAVPVLIPLAVLLLSHVQADVIAPLLRHEGPPLLRWQQELEKRPTAKPTLAGEYLDTRLAQLYGFAVPLTLTILPMALIALYQIGVADARGAAIQLYVDYPAPCIVVRPYDESLICVSVDTSTHTVLPSLTLVAIGGNDVSLRQMTPYILRTAYDSTRSRKVFRANMFSKRPN